MEEAAKKPSPAWEHARAAGTEFVKSVEYAFVNVPVVEKKFVVEAAVPVAFTKVTFCKVEEPESASVVPVRVVPEMVVPVMVVPVTFVPTRLVAKKFVEVADVVVESTPVKFWNVLDPVARILPIVARPLLVKSVP